MRTSLTEIKNIERYLDGTFTPAEHVQFSDQLRLDAPLYMSVFLQRKVRKLVAYYFRNHLKNESAAAFDRLWNDRESIFKKEVTKHFNIQ